MRELEENLYLTRREFLKVLGIGAVVSATGCLDYFKPKETPAPKKRFTPELRIEGDEEFKRNVENMLHVLKEYSLEWYEKTVYAGEVVVQGKVENIFRVLHEYPLEWYKKIIYIKDFIFQSKRDHATEEGIIIIGEDTASYVASYINHSDLKMRYVIVLSATPTFPHEVQHVIDLNVYYNRKKYFKFDKVEKLELELRAGIAEDLYKEEVDGQVSGFFKYYMRGGFNSAYESSYWAFKEGIPRELRINTLKYKDRLDKIERMYFDHRNKKLKTDFLNESWKEFKRLT